MLIGMMRFLLQDKIPGGEAKGMEEFVMGKASILCRPRIYVFALSQSRCNAPLSSRHAAGSGERIRLDTKLNAL